MNSSVLRDPVLRLIVFAILLIGAASEAADGSVLRITLRSAAHVSTPFVTIGDVAEVSGGESALAEFVRGVFLGLSPEADKQRSVSRNDVIARLESCGLSVDSYRVSGAPRMAVGFRAASKARPLWQRASPEAETPTSSLVEAEARLRVRRRSRLVEVEDWATALEAGDRGDEIRVRNERTGKEEVARILGRGTAEFVR